MSYTLLQLRDATRRTSRTVNATAFAPDSVVNRYINESIRALQDHMVINGAGEWFTATATIDLSATPPTSDGLVSLPSDFYQLHDVSWSSSTGRKVPLQSYPKWEQHRYESRGGFPGGLPRYRLLGDVDEGPSPTRGTHVKALRIIPVDTTGSLIVKYVKAMPLLSADTDIVDGFDSWYEFVYVDAAMKLLEEQGQDTTGLEKRRERILTRIMSQAPNMDLGMPDTVQDMSDIGDGLYDDWM